MARVIQKAFLGLGAVVDMHDITACADRSKPFDPSAFQAFVFGAPIHSCRAPRIVREWLATLNGKGKPCAMFFTYGGFGVHPAHYSTREILTRQNFKVVSSAEFLGAHTFNLGGWKAMNGRPDASDDAVARAYVEATYQRFLGEDPAILGALDPSAYTPEVLDQFEGFRFSVLTKLPTRGGLPCSLCMACEDLCPSGAMHAASGEAERDKCIACLRCLSVCPEQVLTINDMTPMWEMKLAMEQTTPAALDAKQSKLYL